MVTQPSNQIIKRRRKYTAYTSLKTRQINPLITPFWEHNYLSLLTSTQAYGRLYSIGKKISPGRF